MTSDPASNGRPEPGPSPRPVTLTFTKFSAAIVIAYLVALLVVAVASLVWLFLRSGLDGFVLATWAGLLSGVFGGTAWYVRRIYRAAFDGRLEIVEPSDVRHMGSVLYIVSRPLMAAGFSLLSSLTTVAAFKSSAPAGTMPTDGLAYSTLLVGFGAGFLSGRFIKNAERSHM